MAQARWSAVPVLAAAVLGGTLSAAEDGPGGPPRPLTLRWHDPSGALPFSHEVLAREVRMVLEPAGLELAWEAAGPDTVDADSELRAVLLGAEQAGPSDVMGSVHRRSASRTAWINLRGVERTLGLPPGPHARRPPEAARDLSRALARVIAHELVHLLAPDLPHTRDGLMASRLGRPFLTARRVALPPALAAALRSAASGEGSLAGRRVALSQP